MATETVPDLLTQVQAEPLGTVDRDTVNRIVRRLVEVPEDKILDVAAFSSSI